MITETDTEIIEKEESTHLRLTKKFMNSIGVECVDSWISIFTVYVPKDEIRLPVHIVGVADSSESYVLLNYRDISIYPDDIKFQGKIAWYDINGFRIIGRISFYSKIKECYHVLVERVDKLPNPKL